VGGVEWGGGAAWLGGWGGVWWLGGGEEVVGGEMGRKPGGDGVSGDRASPRRVFWLKRKNAGERKHWLCGRRRRE